MQLVGFHARQVRDGVCQRGATKRQAERETGPICPDTLANNIVKWHLRVLEGVFNGAIRALAQAGDFGEKVTGMMDGTDLETSEGYTGCGQVIRTVGIEDPRGQVPTIEVTVYGWKLLVLTDVHTKVPLAAEVDKIQEHEVR